MQVRPAPSQGMTYAEQQLLEQQNMLMQQQVTFIEKKNEPLTETSKNVTPEKTTAPKPPKPLT
jgi:hypothetical protein